MTKTPSTYLLGIVGQTTWTVRTTATALSGEPTGAPEGQLLRIALVAPSTMAEGSKYAITSGWNGPGDFGWMQSDSS